MKFRTAAKLIAISVGQRVKRRLTKLVFPPHYGPDSWQHREEVRFSDGTYRALPWHLWPIEGHYAHISMKKPGLIVYTADARDGARDVQTPIKPGKYLEKFYGIKNQIKIRRLVGPVIAHGAQVQFAKTGDEIVRVFERGPHSCMTFLEDKSSSIGWHSARAYGDSDLQIAYIEDHGRIIARTVVWPKKRIYTSAYGNRILLEGALINLGYRWGGHWSLAGARLTIVPNRIVTPKRKPDKPYVELAWPWMDTGPYCHRPIDGTHTKLARTGRTLGRIPVKHFNANQLAIIQETINKRFPQKPAIVWNDFPLRPTASN